MSKMKAIKNQVEYQGDELTAKLEKSKAGLKEKATAAKKKLASSLDGD